MRRMIEVAAPHMLRHYRSDTHWYIPHAAGQLKITLHRIKPKATEYIPGATYYKNATATVSISNAEEFEAQTTTLYYDRPDLFVQWVLPDGTVVNGFEVDAEVSEGETLCISNDFRQFGCSVDCDITLSADLRSIPPFQGSIHTRNSRPCAIADWPKQTEIYSSVKQFYTGGVKICGTETSPSKMKGTTDDIQNLMGGTFKSRIRINYAPDVTGDLGAIKCWAQKHYYQMWGTAFERVYTPGYKNDKATSTTRNFTSDELCMSFHHCGVYGVPVTLANTHGHDWEYYACPNATPEDFDGLIDKIMFSYFYTTGGTVDGVGFVWNASSSGFLNSLTCPSESAQLTGYSYEAGKPIVPAYGTLKISNRTADAAARAEKLAILRAAGWTVEEIDDSLEDGIYAARDV